MINDVQTTATTTTMTTMTTTTTTTTATKQQRKGDASLFARTCSLTYSVQGFRYYQVSHGKTKGCDVLFELFYVLISWIGKPAYPITLILNSILFFKGMIFTTNITLLYFVPFEQTSVIVIILERMFCKNHFKTSDDFFQ